MDLRYSNLRRREKSRYQEKRYKCGYWHIELTRMKLIRNQLKFLEKENRATRETISLDYVVCDWGLKWYLELLFGEGLKWYLELRLWEEKQFRKAAEFPRKAISWCQLHIWPRRIDEKEPPGWWSQEPQANNREQNCLKEEQPEPIPRILL